ncbi:hypothetical protein HY495_00465 [Candidatus Woesearchaeota archaeon]|nr:hypothetical protein [Candidatus Woesearchaeota archaeon]
MRYAFLASPGLAVLTQQELFELTKIKSDVQENAVIFSSENKETIETLLFHMQAPRRFLAVLGCCKKVEQCKIEEHLSSYFQSKATFKIEVENVAGQDQRQVIAKSVYNVLDTIFKNNKINAQVNYKKPDVLVIVYYTGEEYIIGIDLYNQELNGRGYRVFPHSAVFKGDLAYWLIRESGYVPGEKLLIGFVKDGTLAIEAGLYAGYLPIRKNSVKETIPHPFAIIEAFDSSLSNVLAARKNVALAHLKQGINLRHLSLEDLDAHYAELYFDRMIFIITSKDEEKINELYYQARLLLKDGGTILILGRDHWELPISDRFELISEQKIKRGEGASGIWLLRKR